MVAQSLRMVVDAATNEPKRTNSNELSRRPEPASEARVCSGGARIEPPGHRTVTADAVLVLLAARIETFLG